MMRGLPVLFVLAAGCDSPFGDSPFGLAVTDGEVNAALECADLLNSWCLDQDRDGYGAKSGAHPPSDACDFYGDALRQDSTTSSICFPQDESDSSCDIDSYYVKNCSDCDDRRSDVNTGSTECASPGDKQDNDCDGLVDEDHAEVIWYLDYDNDGYGDPTPKNSKTVSSCDGDQPGFVRDEPDMKMDCDDTDDTIYPGADEVRCGDGINHNCDDYVSDCALFQIVEVSTTSLNGVAFVGATTAVAWHGTGTDDSVYFAVGFPVSDSDSDMVKIYRSDVNGPELLSKLTGDPSSGFGSALAVGDFDDDGAVDLAVGTPNNGQGRVITHFALSKADTIEFNARASVTTEVLVGAVLASFGDGSGLAVGYSNQSDGFNRQVALVQSFEKAGETTKDDLGEFLTVDDSNGVAIWPLALASATFTEGTLLGVGFSGAYGGLGPGLAVYRLPSSDVVWTLTDDADSALGASVAFGLLADGATSLVLVGAPEANKGTGAAYLLLGLSTLSGAPNTDFKIGELFTESPSWTTTVTDAQAGSAVALIGDVDLDSVDDSHVGDEELAIGGNGVLWIIAQQDSSFPSGDLDDVASGKITGFDGVIRHIVNAGDVNGDGYSDLLVSTDTTTYLLYGGYAK